MFVNVVNGRRLECKLRDNGLNLRAQCYLNGVNTNYVALPLHTLKA